MSRPSRTTRKNPGGEIWIRCAELPRCLFAGERTLRELFLGLSAGDSFHQIAESLENSLQKPVALIVRVLYDLDPDRATSFFNLALRERSLKIAAYSAPPWRAQDW